ncbi:MAG: SRPBCC family protein [Ferruginibacter sp.]|nr:SRPBCC family protein [Ferruginibacter sp.]
MENSVLITVSVDVESPVSKVWKYWTSPEHIMQWNNASDDWHTPRAENDLRAGGKFLYRMEAKDGSMGFDFSGEYDEIVEFKLIRYTLADSRKVTIEFSGTGNVTQIVETFEAETENSAELQQYGWQCILDNFKKHAESVL